jgi:outer membrane protein
MMMAVTLACAASLAQSGVARAETKIGVINFSRLLQESPAGKVATETLRKEAEAKQGELASMQGALKAKEDRLTKDGATMSADQRTRAEKELRDGSRDLQAKTTEFQDDFNARQNELSNRVQGELIVAVQNYAAAQKFDLVLAEGSIVYANNAMDITSAVLAILPATASMPPRASAPASSAAPRPAPATKPATK